MDGKRALAGIASLVVLVVGVAGQSAPAAQEATTPAYGKTGYYAADAGLTPAQRAGREIWYKATAGNDRFHTYVFQQRIGVLIDWYRVLSSRERDDRFAAWGVINDPDCCQPGSPRCPAKSYDETYGFDWCPGDEELLKFVGKTGYRDPACDFQDAPIPPGDPHGPADQRQSSCDLKFGTSTGVLGLRKFPNPRFNEARWREVNGGRIDTWEGFDRPLSDNPANSDSRVSHLRDGSIEPPFTIGMACGACHIAFDPLNPPDDPAHPKWGNIKGAIGNQYARVSEIMASGMPVNSLEWQVFAHARPGATDTSAVPNDQVNNAGTQNALINIAERPTFPDEVVDRWRAVSSCPDGASEDECWCEPGKATKCWRKGEEVQTVHHVLKGAGDSVAIDLALQRVYINIGSCSEECWVNHLTDMRQIDPQQRGYGQTETDIGQCRRDCPNFRAIEDRIGNVVEFFLSPRVLATDLQQARENEARKKNAKATYTRDDLIDDLEKEFGQGSVSRGRVVFAQNCARCHSSGEGPVEARDFYAVSDATGIRDDWLGNDQLTPVSEVGTNRCRALHSNHMKGHIWGQFSSTTYKQRSVDANIPDPADGGRGYYRNISLVNLWAHAPLLHDNSLGPEICGKPKNDRNDFYRQSYVDGDGKLLANAPGCVEYDPSVAGRFALYKASMEALLHPDRRIPKVTKLDQDIIIDVGPRLWDGEQEKPVLGLQLRVPAGTNAALLGNFLHKEFLVDVVLSKTDPEALHDRLVARMSDAEAGRVSAELGDVANKMFADPASLVGVLGSDPDLLATYSSCTDDVENKGHEFGGDLPESDKQALIAFLATL